MRGVLDPGSGGERPPVPAEGNFEELPYFKVGDRSSGTGVMEYNGVIRTRDGHTLRQKWVVRAAQGLGLPGRLDQDVYVAVLQLIDRRGGIPESGEVEFSMYELAELTGAAHGGMNYRRIRESLRRMALTGIESVNAFYHKQSQSYISDTFQLWSVHFADHDDGRGGQVERHKLRLSEFFTDSYRSNYLKGLNVGFYWSLRSPVAKRLYRLVDKKRNHRRRWDIEIFSLRDRVALSPEYRYPSRIKDKLKPAHNELILKGFLEEVSFYKNEAGENRVCYLINERFADLARERERTDALPRNEDEKIVSERLQTEGIPAQLAAELVSSYGHERCRRYVEALPFQRNVRNPGGWLRWAIETAPELDLPNPSSNTRKTPQEDLFEGLCEEAVDPPDVVPENPSEEDPEAKEAWEVLLGELLQDGDHPPWFEGFVPTDLTSSSLTVTAPNPSAASYVEDRYGPRLRESWSTLQGERATLYIST